MWRLPTYRRRVGVTFLATLGVTNTLAQLVLWSLGAEGGRLLQYTVLLLVPLQGALAVLISSPQDSITLSHPLTRSRITIRFGDLLDPLPDGLTVVTTNRHFDLEPPLVSPRSLVAQLVTRRFDGDGAALGKLICAGDDGGRVPAAVGAMRHVSTSEGGVVLLAVAARDEKTRSAVLVDEIWTALDALWRHARSQDVRVVRVPVVGAGHARAQVGLKPLLVLLLTSFLTSTLEKPICELELVLAPDVAGSDAMELATFYCRSLGFA